MHLSFTTLGLDLTNIELLYSKTETLLLRFNEDIIILT